MRSKKNLMDEDRAFLASLVDGQQRQERAAGFKHRGQRLSTKLFTHNGPWGIAPATA